VSETAEQGKANAIEIASLFHVSSVPQTTADSEEREGTVRAPAVNLTGLMWDVWSSVANHADAEIFMNPVSLLLLLLLLLSSPLLSPPLLSYLPPWNT